MKQGMKQEADQGQPQKKKLRLEDMGFGNMGSGFGCSLFVPNQGEEMPTMLQMGYAGEGPGTGIGEAPMDDGSGFGNYADDGMFLELHFCYVLSHNFKNILFSF